MALSYRCIRHPAGCTTIRVTLIYPLPTITIRQGPVFLNLSRRCASRPRDFGGYSTAGLERRSGRSVIAIAFTLNKPMETLRICCDMPGVRPKPPSVDRARPLRVRVMLSLSTDPMWTISDMRKREDFVATIWALRYHKGRTCERSETLR